MRRRRRRWRASARVAMCALAAVCLALAVTVGCSAPTAWASGPGPCAAPTPADIALPAFAPKGTASARLSRSQGAVGTALSLIGAGWPAGAAVAIDIYAKRNGHFFVADALAQGIASADGRLSIGPFRAPLLGTCSSLSDTHDGGTALFLVHTADGHTRTPILFTYLTYTSGPQVTSAPYGQALAPGTQVSVTGSHWEPGEQVTLTAMVAPWTSGLQLPRYQRAPTAAVHVAADSQGAFSVTMPTLDEPPETQLVFMAQGTGPRYGDVAVETGTYVMLPKVYPSIHLDHSNISVGAALTVTGDHWPAHATGQIEYCRGQSSTAGMVGLRCLGAQHLGDFQADSDGHFSVTIHIPANARLGPVTIQARDPDAAFGLIVYAQGQPLTITPTFAQAHPRLSQLSAAVEYFGGWLMLFAAIVASLITVQRRPNRHSPLTP